MTKSKYIYQNISGDDVYKKIRVASLYNGKIKHPDWMLKEVT